MVEDYVHADLPDFSKRVCQYFLDLAFGLVYQVSFLQEGPWIPAKPGKVCSNAGGSACFPGLADNCQLVLSLQKLKCTLIIHFFMQTQFIGTYGRPNFYKLVFTDQIVKKVILAY